MEGLVQRKFEKFWRVNNSKIYNSYLLYSIRAFYSINKNLNEIRDVILRFLTLSLKLAGHDNSHRHDNSQIISKFDHMPIRNGGLD